MTRDTVERPRRGQTPATGPRTGQVRIIGAERAADVATPRDEDEGEGRDDARSPSHARPETGTDAGAGEPGADLGVRAAEEGGGETGDARVDDAQTGAQATEQVTSASTDTGETDTGETATGETDARATDTGDTATGDTDARATDAANAGAGQWEAEDWEAEDWEIDAWGAEEPQADQPVDEPAAWMPHWTEAPTGEVPAVLARDDEDARSARPEPSWREDPNDWELDASLARPILEEEDADAIGAADAADRQPWTFELDADADRQPGGTAGPREAGRTESVALGDLEGGDDRAADTARDPFAQWSPTGEHPVVGHGEPGSGPAGGATVGDGGGDPTTRVGAVGAAWGYGERAAGDAGAAGDVAGAEGPDASGRPVGSRGRGLAGEEAAALAADLEAHGLRRMWERRRPEAVRGGTARHRARTAPTPVDETAEPAEGGAAPSRTGRNIPAAIGSGVVIGALVLLAFHFGTVPAMVVVTAVIVLAAAEAYGALRRGGQRPATLLGLAAVLAVLVGTYDQAFQAVPVVLVLLVAGTFLWHLAKVDAKADPLRSSAATLLVFCWVGVFGSFAALLLAPSMFPDRHGIAYLLGALISAVAYDVGALVVGAWVGRHPMTAVSPAKTWEGAIGGGVAAIVLAVAVVRLIHPWTLAETVVLGIVVAVVSPLGDLSESLVKRHLGVKDMGRILPGHGGILDRVDGMLFVLPATYYLLRAFGHG